MKKSENSSNQGFPYYFCLIIEGSGTATSLTSKHSFNQHFFALHMDLAQNVSSRNLA